MGVRAVHGCVQYMGKNGSNSYLRVVTVCAIDGKCVSSNGIYESSIRYSLRPCVVVETGDNIHPNM